MFDRVQGKQWFATALLAAVLGALGGCSQGSPPTGDPQPFKTAIAQYLDQHNMAMAVKEIKEGPVIEGNRAKLKASLTHATMGGPSVTWEFRFEKDAGGGWKAVAHQQ